MAVTFTFNGTDSDDMGLTVSNIVRDIAMPIEPQLAEIPGRDGAYLFGILKKSRQIRVSVVLRGTTMADIRSKARSVAMWLISDELKSLSFSDDAGKAYRAIFVGSSDVEQLLTTGRVELTFLIPDPYTYAVSETMTANIAAGNNEIPNAGGAPAFPRFRLPFATSAKILRLEHEDGRFLQIGATDDVDKDGVEEEPVELIDACETADGWSLGTHADGGIVTGTMATNGFSFSPLWTGGSIGAGAAWHGPTIRRALTLPVSDFSVSVNIGLLNAAVANDKIGRVDIYLLNSSGDVIAKMAMKDASSTIADAWAEMRIGSLTDVNRHSMINTHGAKAGVWNNFDGVLKITRTGNLWTGYVAMITSEGFHHTRLGTSYVDVNSNHNDDLAMIELHVGGKGTSPMVQGAYIKHVAINGVVSIDEEAEQPYAITAGSLIEIDMAKCSVLNNGEPFMKDVDFGSDFFDIPVGGATISVLTDGTIGVVKDVHDVHQNPMAYLRERWM